MTFLLFFKVPINIGIYMQSFLFPLEKSCFLILVVFTIFEFIFGIIAIITISRQTTAAFYLRNAPMIDPRYSMTFNSSKTVKSTRELALGLKGYQSDAKYENNKWQKDISLQRKR